MQTIYKEVQAAALSPDRVRDDMRALHAQGYEHLAAVMLRALFQAAHGKGAERHAQAAPFDQQPMQQLINLYGPGFALGQAAKKAQEAMRLPRERAVAELLGAINYLAGAVISLESSRPPAMMAEAANDNVARVVQSGR